ncbi:MAG: hypothetical protein WAL81_03185 [Methanobacterium sp.]
MGGDVIATRITSQKIDDENSLGDILIFNESKHQIYPLTQPPETLEELKIIINNLINSTENMDLLMGLKIIKTLITHNKKEVVASSLGNLYILIRDESIRKLIINELNEMRCDDRISVRRSAEDSLDVISGEVNKYEIFEFSFDILTQILYKFDNYLHSKHYFNSLNLKYITKINAALKSMINHSRFVESWNDMMYNLLRVMLVIDHDMDIFHMDNVDVNDYYQNNMDKLFNIPYTELSEIEVTEDTYINTLIHVYATTFRENGHIYRLESLLDDDNYKIRHMAVLGLIYALKVLTNFHEDKPFENLISEVLENISNTQFKHRIKVGYGSK